MSRRAAAFGVQALLVLLFVGARVAAADELDRPTDSEAIALEASSSADARGCADASVLRARIAERLGREPFSPPSAGATGATGGSGRTLRVKFARDRSHRFTAEIELFDAKDTRVGGRSLNHTGPTCEPLVSSVVLTIAVLLEDLAPPSASAPPPPAPPPAAPPASTSPEPVDEPPPITAVPPPSPRTTFLDLALGGAGTLGGAPAPSVGGELTLGLDLARWRIELGGRMFAPTSSGEDVAVRTRLVHGRLAPCWGLPWLAGCVVAVVGSMSGEAVGQGVTASQLASQVYAAGGIGVLSRVFVVRDVLFVRASVDTLFAATRAGFDVGDRRVWTVPVVSGAAALALGVRLP